MTESIWKNLFECVYWFTEHNNYEGDNLSMYYLLLAVSGEDD